MQNEEHLKILNQGVDVWNHWREVNPDIIPRLRGADLREALKRKEDTLLTSLNLERADLRKANLCETHLFKARLMKADLSYAQLSKANLGGANFTGANLWEADLTMADLAMADLSDANLTGACLQRARLRSNFMRANLTRAILNDAYLLEANLMGANLSRVESQHANFVRANLRGANLSRADLSRTDLNGANLAGANLSGTSLYMSDLLEADLTGANLTGANISGADLCDADLGGADLTGANISRANLVRTNFQDAVLTDCRIYGISVWDLQGIPKAQSDLVITPKGAAAVTVDDLKVAQFVYLLLHNPNIRDVIDTIGKKGVLILGRFGERLIVLNALRETVRDAGFVPIVFDFERANSQDFTQTVMTLAGMSAFIIADITKPRSVQQELQATIPNYMIPFVPIIQEGEEPYSMFVDLQNKYDKWVLDLLVYADVDQLVRVVEIAIIKPAETKRRFLLAEKAKGIRKRYASEFEKA
jgi:uncharacterized protein YjbI with pentapeptide repeats